MWQCFHLQLLDFEVHARDQVPLLMEMKKADLALDKAMESGDPQLGNNPGNQIMSEFVLA